MSDALRRLLGQDRVAELAPDAEPGRELLTGPALAVTPADEEQCAAALRVAAEQRLAVVPVGGGRHLRSTNAPERVDVVLLTRDLAGIVDHDSADETLVVRAGTRLVDVALALRARGQLLPLDPAGGPAATVGGVVAAGVTGRLRTGYGLPRDWVLGTRAAHPDGAVTKSGGRLVKNVTGFDLHRLYHGSHGSLAVLTELALRARPLPEREATLLAALPGAAALDGFVAAWRAAGGAAVAHAALDAGSFARLAAPAAVTGPHDSLVVALRFHGRDRAVADRMARARELLAGRSAAPPAALEGAAEASLWEKLAAAGDGPFVAKLAFLPIARGRSVAGALTERMTGCCARHGVEAGVLLEPDLGLLRIVLAAPPGRSLLDDLIDASRAGDLVARLTVEAAPLAWRRGRDVFLGQRAADGGMGARVKQALDPSGVLGPGRLVAGGSR